MKKDELQRHQSDYTGLVSRAAAAEREGFPREAIRLARSAWPHIDGTL